MILAGAIGLAANFATCWYLADKHAAAVHRAFSVPAGWPLPAPGHWPVAPLTEMVETQLGVTVTSAEADCTVGSDGSESPDQLFRQVVVEFGAPMRSFRAETVVQGESSEPWTWRQGIFVPPPARFGQPRPRRATPLVPCWPGVAVNTALYAVPALAWFAALDVRGWHRRRRGACVLCGYAIGADMAANCPECGAARSSV